MKSHPGVLVRILFSAALALGEFGCGSRAPVTVTVTPTSATVAPGATVAFSATSSNNSSVNWLISCSTPPCGSVSPTTTASGALTTYTAPPTALANNLAITITATAYSASARATVTLPSYQASVSSSVSQVNRGGTAQLSAQAVNGPADATFNWTLSCTPAPCGMLSPTTTPSGLQRATQLPHPLPWQD